MSQITLKDIAEKLGVSHVAVSLALRGRGRISAELRATVKRVAEEMGYRPDPTARALVEYRQNRPTHNIHAALAWINSWKVPKQLRTYREFDLYWQGAFATADAAGFRLEEFDVTPQLSLARLEKILLTRNIQGIIIPPHQEPIDWSGLDWNRFSCVRIGYSLPSPQAYIVAPDQGGNAMLAFKRTKELGYKRIGYISWATGKSKDPSRFLGGILMMQVNEPASLRVPPLLLAQKSEEQDQKKFNDWINSHKPDAILTELGPTRKMIERAGLKVGKDVGLGVMSVLDGNADSGIYQNPELIGRAATEVLISLINRQELGGSPDYRTALVRGKWVHGSDLPARR